MTQNQGMTTLSEIMAKLQREESPENYGDHPPLTSLEFTNKGPGKPVVMGPKSPNGTARAMLSCKCGRTITAELYLTSDAWSDMRDEAAWNLPQGWHLELVCKDFNAAGEICVERGATIVRCPDHRQLI